jgi:uncharacterized protein (TIGR01244 family)
MRGQATGRWILAVCAALATANALAVDPVVTTVPGWREVEPGIYSAAQPGEADWGAIAAVGVATVVNLRAPEEQPGVDEGALVREAGLDYVEFPVSTADDFSAPRVAEFAALIAKLRQGGVLVHCGSGNRVGAMLALAKGQEAGVGVDEAIAYGRNAGLAGLEPQIRQRLEAGR